MSAAKRVRTISPSVAPPLLCTMYADVRDTEHPWYSADWDPLAVRPAEPKPSCTRAGDSSLSEIGSEGCSIANFHLAADADFVAGGWHRGAALAHLRVVAGVVEFGPGGKLGPTFDAYLREYDPVVLVEIVNDYHRGIDVYRDLSAEFIAQVLPSDPVDLERVRHSAPPPSFGMPRSVKSGFRSCRARPLKRFGLGLSGVSGVLLMSCWVGGCRWFCTK
jgi:hypothetical protein